MLPRGVCLGAVFGGRGRIVHDRYLCTFFNAIRRKKCHPEGGTQDQPLFTFSDDNSPHSDRRGAGVRGLKGPDPHTRDPHYPLLAGQGQAGFQLEGGVDTAPWRDPPPPKKGAQLTGPPNPTKTDPRAPELTQTQKTAKKWKWIFGISASRGFRKVIICRAFGEKNLTITNAQKNFRCLQRQSS